LRALKSPFKPAAQVIEELREHERIAGFVEIARRALANNAFDGVLTTIGLLMGSYLSGIRNAGTVIRTGVATSIAMGVSGLWGAYLAESAERGRDLAELEQISMTDLSQTKIGRASRVAVIVVSVVDGLAPLGSSIIVLIPMFVARATGAVTLAYLLSMIVALVALFALGMFLGRTSGAGMVRYGVRTVIAGVVSILLSFLLGAE